MLVRSSSLKISKSLMPFQGHLQAARRRLGKHLQAHYDLGLVRHRVATTFVVFEEHPFPCVDVLHDVGESLGLARDIDVPLNVMKSRVAPRNDRYDQSSPRLEPIALGHIVEGKLLLACQRQVEVAPKVFRQLDGLSAAHESAVM